MGFISAPSIIVPVGEVGVGVGSLGVAGDPGFTYARVGNITTNATLLVQSTGPNRSAALVTNASEGVLGLSGSSSVNIFSLATTGASAADMTTCTNKPGPNPRTQPDVWLNMLANGTQYWIPGFQD